MEKKKIFISAPFAGNSEPEILSNFSRTALKTLKDHKIDVYEANFVTNLHPGKVVEHKASKAKHPELVYLASALMKMANCDDVVFGEGWRNARGCLVENLVYCLYFDNKGS